MNIFGIGTQELIFLLILAFLLLGPEESVTVARSLGRLLRKVYMSTTWRLIARLRYELENIVREEIRKAGLEELERLQREGVWPPPELNPDIGTLLAEPPTPKPAAAAEVHPATTVSPAPVAGAEASPRNAE